MQLTTMKAAVIVAAFGSCLLSSAASAALMSATYEGEVVSGVDLAGVFGGVGADLVGQRFTVNYIYETADGTITPFANLVRLTGGTAFGGGQPMKSASATILGKTYTYDLSSGPFYGAYASQAHVQGDGFVLPYTGLATHMAQASDLLGVEAVLATNDELPLDLEAPFVAHVAGPPYDSAYDLNLRLPGPGGAKVYNIFGSSNLLTVTRLDLPVDGVPEPGAWALMIGGFGLAGAVLRRKRSLLAT